MRCRSRATGNWLRTRRRYGVKASGLDGELRVGYQRAARLEGWSLEVTPAARTTVFAVMARASHVDAFWCTQAPQRLDLRFGRFHWIWEDVRPTYVNGTVSVRVLGAPHIVKE